MAGDPKRQFLTFNQLVTRWGNCSHMTIERKIRTDPEFPKTHRIGRTGRSRLFDLDEVERYERLAVVAPKKKKLEAAE